jgi:hypothetical protein
MYCLISVASSLHLILTVICICAEQTFIQASVTQEGFAQAFLIALDAYMKSTVRDEANQAIKVLLGGRDSPDRLDDFLLKGLVNIIKNHCLRMWLFFECQWPHS